MDALNLNPIQSGAPAGAGFTIDVPPDGADGAIDFAALLALGLSAGAQDEQGLQAQEMIDVDRAVANDAEPSPESFFALPLSVEASARQELTPITPAASSDDAQPQAPSTASAPAVDVASARSAHRAFTGVETASHPAAAVADDAANIAGKLDAHAPATPSASNVESTEKSLQSAADFVALDATRSSEAAARAQPHHAMTVHPAETRAPSPQPSALLDVQAPVSEPGFAQALSRQVVWMVDKDAQVAELRINPPELGPVEVRLTLTHDSAAAEFVSPHAEVRAAIEGAIVRLREALADAGIQLGEASVSAESFSDRAGAEQQPRHARDGYSETPFSAQGGAQLSGRTATLGRGLVDVFA